EGVRLHWISPQGEDGPVIVGADNSVEDSSCRRGPARLPLRENDWNSVEVSVVGDNVRIQLNGELVFERPIEPTNNRRFGLFRYKGQTAAEVRDIVLSGDWPESLPAESDLLALAPLAANDAVLRTRHTLVSEGVLGDEAYAIWQKAMNLPIEERFTLLKEWVL